MVVELLKDENQIANLKNPSLLKIETQEFEDSQSEC
jgi:hypothetical protein